MNGVTILILAAAGFWFVMGQPVIAVLILAFLPVTWRNTKAVEEAPTLTAASWETATSVVMVLALGAIIIFVAFAGGGASLSGNSTELFKALLGD